MSVTRRIPSTLAEPSVERGETSAETVIAVPLVFAVLMIAVHAAAFLHGAQVAMEDNGPGLRVRLVFTGGGC